MATNCTQVAHCTTPGCSWYTVASCLRQETGEDVIDGRMFHVSSEPMLCVNMHKEDRRHWLNNQGNVHGNKGLAMDLLLSLVLTYVSTSIFTAFRLFTVPCAVGKKWKPWSLAFILSWFCDVSEEIMNDIGSPQKVRACCTNHLGKKKLPFFQICGLELEKYIVCGSLSVYFYFTDF